MARKTAAEIEKLFAESGGAVGNEVTNAANTINRVTSGLANSGQKFDTTPQPQATAAAGTVGTAVGTVGTVGTGAKPAATAPVSQFDVLTDFSKGLDKTATDMKRVKPSGNDLSANAVYIDQTAKDADKAYGDYVKASRDIGRAQTYNVQHQKNLQKIAADDGAQIDKNGNLVFQTEAGLKAYQSEMESYRKSSAATEGGASRLRDSATSYQSNVGKMNDMIVTSKRVAAQTRSTEEIENDISRLRFSGVAADDPNMIRLQTELRNRMYLGDDSLTQTSSGYYTDRATAAIQSGDYDAALRWANRMVSAPLTLEERQKATDWLNTVKGMSDTELNLNNGAIGGEFLVDTYDRDPGQFIDLIYDDYGRKYVDAVARQYGINPPKGAANYSDYAQYIEEVRNAIATDVAVNASGQSETDFQRYSIDKLNGSIDGLKQRNADAYFNQKIKDSVNAIEQRGGSLAYDYHAYENAQRAYTTLAYLQGALHTNEGGDYTGGGEKDLKKFQIQPMLDELKKYGFDIDLSAANYMTAINESADLASRRAQQYRSELESRSATEGYSINVYDLGLYLHNAQSAEIGKIIDTAYADYLARNRKDLRDMSYIDLTIRLGDRILANSILSAAAQFAGAGIVTGVNNLLVTYGADGNDNLASYRPIMSGTIVSNPATALRSKTSETISKAYGSLAGSLYDGVMSSVDSTLGALGMGVAYTPVMGLSSAGDKIVEVLDDGGSAQQAFAMGVASALIESGTEYVSLDLLVKGFHETNLVKKLTNILIQGGVEASEEAVGEVLDQMADWYIMGSASAKSKEIEDLMDRGMSYSEAMKKVGYGSAMDILKSAAVGAFSGVLGSGGSGIGTTVMQTVNVSTFASNAADEVFRSRNYDPAGYDLYCKMAGVYSDDSDAVVQRKLKAFFSAVADAKNDAIRAEENAIVRSESKEQEQTAARAEAVEAQASADGEKVTAIRSAAVQKYIDSGKMNYATAQKAGAVLDRIYIGELTAENISSNDIDALNLTHPYAAAIASEVLGIEVKPASSKSEARRTFKAAVQNFAQTKVATVQAESVAVDEAKSEMFDTSAESAAQAQNRPTGNYVTTRTVPTVRRVIPRASAVQTAQTVEADPAPVAQTAPTQAAQPVQTAEAQTAEVAQSSGTPMTYRQWLAANANNRRIKKMSSEEKTSEYVKYRDSFGGSNTETGTMSRTQFAESYRAENPGASEVETDIAYQNYRQDNGLEAKSEQTSGIVRNEYSQRLNADTVDSVDALLRLFGLKGRFDDLGDANGYYDVETGEVVLDIAPIEANSSNAFLFAVSHELGHAIRDRIGPTAWNSFQKYAIAAMGGEAAVKAKQSSNEVYSNVVDAREDVACDFIGRLLSDKDTLNAFTEAIRKGEIQPEHASKIASVFRSVIGKLTGKGSKQNTSTAALVDKVRKDFKIGVEQAENVVRELQKAAAAAKNTQQRVIPRAEGVRNSMKAPTEQNAGSPFPTVNIDGQKVRPNKLYSMKSFADGTGFSLRQDENGVYRILSDSTGKVIDKVTPSMITDSPIGRLVGAALTNGNISKAEANSQYKAIADMLNYIVNQTADAQMSWSVFGTMMWQAIKTNSDKQYSKTIDFGTVCIKTQQMIENMSEAMLRLHRGLTIDEVLDVYAKTVESGEQVPCNCCYVFSRWMGMGGLLDGIKQMQDTYIPRIGSDKAKLNAFMSGIESYVNANGKGAGFGKKISDLKNKASSRINRLTAKLADSIDATIQLDELLNTYEGTDMNASLAKSLNGQVRALTKKILTAEQQSVIRSNIEAYTNGGTVVNDDGSKTEVMGLNDLNAYQWAAATVAVGDGNGGWTLREGYKPVPDDVLFNPNDGQSFALNYPDTWSYRTTRGCAAGKAVTPYADARVGDILQGIASSDLKSIKSGSLATRGGTIRAVLNDVAGLDNGTIDDIVSTVEDISKSTGKRIEALREAMDSAIIGIDGRIPSDVIDKVMDIASRPESPFSRPSDAASQKVVNDIIENARKKQKAQNLIGGMRFQSTSDFRFDWASDYFMAFLEMQAANANVQLYTKVLEAVPFFCQVGCDVNMSAIAMGQGYHYDDNGNPVLDFSSTSGVDGAMATELARNYNNAQIILVGMSDEHIRIAINDMEVDANGNPLRRVHFVIPWHSSGSSVHLISRMMEIIGELTPEQIKYFETAASDYTNVQSDRMIDNPTEEQRNNYTVRKLIVSGKLKSLANKTNLGTAPVKEYGNLSEQEVMDIIHNYEVTVQCDGEEFTYRILENLFNRFYVDENSDAYGCALPSGSNTDTTADQVFPHEYWDKTTTYLTANRNGEIFKAYCDSIGLIPRFSGIAGYKDGKAEMATHDVDGKPAVYGNFSGWSVDGKHSQADWGYWKLLIDRSMYNHTDSDVSKWTYRDQQTINVSGVDAYDLLPYKPTADNDPVHRRFLPEDASESRGIKTRAESEMKLGEASIVPKSLNDSRKVKATIDSVTSDWATEAQADAITQMSKKEKSLAASKRAIEVKASVEAKQNVFKANLDKNGNRKYSMKPSDTAAQTEASTREERKAAREEASQRVMRKREGTDLLSVMKPNAKPSMKDAVDRYGAIPEGERPVREIKVPRRVEPNTKVRQTVRTALESAITPDSIVPSIEQDVINGMFNYTPDTNKAQMERANEWISNKSIEAARDEWFKSISSGKRSVDLIARGVLLYNEYATASNDTSLGEKERKVNRETATRILADMAAAATEAAQQTQMIRLLKKQTPDMQLYALQRSIQKLQDQLNERYKKKSAPQIVLNQELAERWMTALRSKDMELAHDVEVALYEDIARQIPKTFMDIMNAWRYLGMLGNGKTIIRNTIGNLMMTPMVTAKNRLGAVGEAIAQKTGRLSKSSRTKYNGVLTATKEGRNMLKFAEEDYLEFDTQDMLDGGTGKHNDSIGTKLDRAIRDAHSQFNAPGLKQWQQATNWLMNEAPGISDKAFMKHHYKAAFAQAAMARGFTASDFRDGRVKPEQLDSLRAYAVHQAQKATYHDSNAVSRALQGLRYKGNSRAGKIANVAIEGVIPFKGTPANVLMRSLEYSPLGLAKALTYDAWQSLKSKKVPVSTWLENLSSGLTGSALVALGYFMSSIGLLRVNADDDDKREGRQAYSIEVGGMSFSIDWLAPFAVPLFVGAEVNEYDSNGESLGSAIMDATSKLTAPILEMSMLSGVKDLLDTMTYAENGADVAQIVYSFFFLPFLNYASQFIPTAVSQVANSLEDNKTTTYVGDVSSQFDRNLIRNLAKITEKIPYVDAWQIDYVDNWGNKQENGAWYERLFNNFLNPAYTSSINVTDADSEIRRLKEIFGSDASGIEPDRRGYKIKVGEGDNRKDVTLNGEQYEKYQTAFGQQYALMVTALMASEVYDTLSDAEKLKAFEDIRTLANEYGKVAADVRYKVGDSGSNKLYDLMNAGIPISEAYAAKLMNTYLNSDTNADLTAKDKYEMFQLWLSDKDVWTSEQKSLVAEKYGKFYSMVAVGSKNFDEMQASGVSAEKSRAVSDAIGNIEPIGDNEQATQLQKMQAIVSVEGLSPKEQDAALRAYLDSSALQKYDACSTAGVTAKQYVSVYSKIDGVTPREGTKSAAVDQKLQIVVSTVSSERGQDAMFRNFLDNDAVPKYEAARAAGVSPKVFADFYSAKYTYGNANGSWSKSELVAWIKELGLSDSQADAIMKAANKNWSW